MEEKWINFKIESKSDKRLYLKGEVNINSIDDTDGGDWGYEQNNGLWDSHIPSYWKVGNENLTDEFGHFLNLVDWEDFQQALCDFQDENRTFDCGDYILHINEGAFVDMEIQKHSNFEDTFRANLIFKYNGELIEFDEDIIKDLSDDLIYDDEYCEVTSSSSIDLELPRI